MKNTTTTPIQTKKPVLKAYTTKKTHYKKNGRNYQQYIYLGYNMNNNINYLNKSHIPIVKISIKQVSQTAVVKRKTNYFIQITGQNFFILIFLF